MLGFIAAVLLPLLTGILSALLADFSSYDSLNMPPLSPMPIVFTLVWGVIYVLWGVSSFMIWRDTAKFTPGKLDTSLIYYFISILIAFLWPLFFFNMGMRLLSAAWLGILIAVTVIVAVKFYKTNKYAAYLHIPIILWLLFALYLNIGFVVLNG